MTTTITNSSITCFKTCRQKYYWQYELGWRPDVESKPLRIGSMVHEGLDMLAKGKPLPETLAEIKHLYADYDGLDYECVTVCCLLAGYVDAWSHSQVEIIESEVSFDLPILNPNSNPMTSIRQAGKRDRIGRLPDGRIALMETKTVGQDISPQSDYRQVLSINQQVSMYVNAARAEGLAIETTLYDCIRKPTIKPTDIPLVDNEGFKIVLGSDGERVFNGGGKPRQTSSSKDGYILQTRPMTAEEWQQKLSEDIATRPEYYYQRFEVPRLQDDLDAFNIELWQVAKDINECRRLGRWYKTTSNCRKYNSMCPYYPLCAGERDISNGVPSGFRQAETMHEEL